jgi:hypothetical protein
MRQSFPLVLVLFFAPVLVYAQHAGAPAMPPMAAHPVASIPVAPASHPAPVASVASTHANSHSVASGHRALSSSPRGAARPATSSKVTGNPQPVPSANGFTGAPVAEDDLGAPGLGFDYAHYAAVHPNSGRHLFSGGIVPFVGGGIYIPYPVYLDNGSTAEPAAESTQAEVERPAEDTVTRPEPALVRSHAHSNLPIEQDSEYVFVRRDGTVFFAVAFTFDSTDLRYVTQDGFRRSVPLASLDLAATQQFNEQRGLSPRLPS